MFAGHVFKTAGLMRFLATQPEIIILNPAITQFSDCMGTPKGPKDFVKLEIFTAPFLLSWSKYLTAMFLNSQTPKFTAV